MTTSCRQVVWGRHIPGGRKWVEAFEFHSAERSSYPSELVYNSHQDWNYLMHRYVVGERMRPDQARDRIRAEDEELGRLVATFVSVSSL